MSSTASPEASLDQLTYFSMAGAALMVAHQIAAKAARDGLFLSIFPITDLPKVVALAAAISIVLGVLFSRLLGRYSPSRVLPIAVIVSAAAHVVEYATLEANRGLVVTFTYLHIVGLGAIILSGFWSVANEAFDPREAKRRFGRIAGAGTAGGISGGLIAERTVAYFNPDSLLILLAILHIVVFAVLVRIRSLAGNQTKTLDPVAGFVAARKAFQRAPFLFSLAILVLLGTTSAALLDYLFKSGATENFGKGPELTRYFAIFYTGAQVLTFLVQTFLTPIALEQAGLGRTVMTLALGIIGGASAALAVPAFAMTASVRAVEMILRGSFFRSGYELFFTPIPKHDKRAVKTVIDVGCDRFGDAIGAGALQLLVLMGAAHARVEILLITMGLAGISIWITMRMDRAYVQVLERGLIDRAVELDVNEVEDSTTMSAVLNTGKLPPPPVTGKPAPPAAKPQKPANDDNVFELMGRLRGGDAPDVLRALGSLDRWEPLVAPQVIRLLAWDEVSEAARKALVKNGARITGQLSDSLLDEQQDFAVRRRIPRILAYCGSRLAFDSLLAAQTDPRFEIRFQASRALDYLKQHHAELTVNEAALFPIVARELSVSRPIWEGRKLLDTRDSGDSGFSFLDDVLKERANQSLEHVFSLLALVLPREPLKVAFRALHSDDRQLRGLGIEYLASTLPDTVYKQITELLEATPPSPGRSQQEVLDELMLRSGDSIAIELRRKAGDALSPDAPQSTTIGS